MEEHIHSFPKALEDCWQKQRQAEAFAYCVSCADTIGAQNVMNAAQACFMWLFFFDLAQRFNQVNNTTHTGRRIGKRMTENTLAFLSGDSRREAFDNTKGLTDVKDKMKRWMRWGPKLEQLYDEFGEGALLILAEKLSEGMQVSPGRYAYARPNVVRSLMFHDVQDGKKY